MPAVGGPFEDWEHSSKFIAELMGPQSVSAPASANWIHPFSTFDDIANVLRVGLGLTGDVEERALLELACQEIEDFLRLVVHQQHDGSWTFCTAQMARFERLVDIQALADHIDVGLEQKVTLEADSRHLLMQSCFALWGQIPPPMLALERGANSAAFTTFDGSSRRMQVKPIKSALREAFRRISAITHERFLRTLDDVRNRTMLDLHGCGGHAAWPVSVVNVLGMVGVLKAIDDAIRAGARVIRLVRLGGNSSEEDAAPIAEPAQRRSVAPISEIHRLCMQRRNG